jgi:hypothetical protein
VPAVFLTAGTHQSSSAVPRQHDCSTNPPLPHLLLLKLSNRQQIRVSQGHQPNQGCEKNIVIVLVIFDYDNIFNVLVIFD